MSHIFRDSDSEINTVFHENNIFGNNNSFPIEEESCYDGASNDYPLFNNVYPQTGIDNYCYDGDKIFDDNIQKRGCLNNDGILNFERKEYTSLFSNKIEFKTTKETNFTELVAKKPKRKPLFEVKKEIYEQPKIINDIKEIPPDFFPEKSINIIIDKFYIIEDKSNLLLDMDIKNIDINKLRQILESDYIKRRKKINDIAFRYDHILSKLINIINLSLLDFINNLINGIYSSDEINQIIEGLNLQMKISSKDLKQIIKKIDYKSRKKLKKIKNILKFLDSTLKKFLSDNISNKYDSLKYPPNYNELILNKILEDEDNKDVFEFILNELTIKDWLELFLYKKEFKDFKNYNSFSISKKNKIKGSLRGIDKYLHKIIKTCESYKNNKIYFHLFSLISYNLRRFLLNKETRNRNHEETKKETEDEN